jgi:hypothetical protein
VADRARAAAQRARSHAEDLAKRAQDRDGGR